MKPYIDKNSNLYTPILNTWIIKNSVSVEGIKYFINSGENINKETRILH